MNIRNLLTVKSLVTLFLTVVFGVLCISDFLLNQEINDLLKAVYPVIIGWYFGSQETKRDPADIVTKSENINI